MDDFDGDDNAEQPMTQGDLLRLGAKWLARIKASEKREDRWITEAEAAEKAYLCDKDSKAEGRVYDFNILHSNIETLAPAVFNSAPVPDVRERFRTGGDTPEAETSRQVAQVIERAISVQIDDGALTVELDSVTQDALLVGRAVIRVRFDADEQEIPGQPIMDPMTGLQAFDEAGMPAMSPAQMIMVNERLTYECVSWRDYREGPAKRWDQVPWVAFRHCLPWEEVQRIQDPALKEILSVGGTDEETEPDADADTHIWEVWDAATGKVYMIVADSGEVLSITPDPMGLNGFFPIVRPVVPIKATGDRCPVSPFTIYKKLADELETITRRIKAITEGLRVRGGVAGDAADIERMAAAGDNELVPIANLEGYAATGGISNAIVWWPIETAVAVLRELYTSRDQCKAMIYEVTGISDIVRGQGVASETATAQEIKSQWGSLRIRKLQQMIEMAARDVFVLSAELISSKFSPQTLQRMTGIQITPEMAQMLAGPLDNYRIDVESDSTVRADLTRRKGEMSEFLQGTAAFFSAMAPVVQGAPGMAVPVSEIYASFARQFSLGKQAEDALEQMGVAAKEQAKQAQENPPGPSPDQMKAEADIEATKAKMAIEAKRLTLDERNSEINALEKLARIG